jgi:hypothetical protein
MMLLPCKIVHEQIEPENSIEKKKTMVAWATQENARAVNLS